MNTLKDIEIQLASGGVICHELEEKIKISRKRIETLKQQKHKLIQNCTFKEKLEIHFLNLSEYVKIDVNMYFNVWWSKFLKIYSYVNVKDGRYYGELDDNLKDILIINLYDKNINDLVNVGNLLVNINMYKNV
jgi:hypothetical protein